jgi:hypothetical protein
MRACAKPSARTIRGTVSPAEPVEEEEEELVAAMEAAAVDEEEEEEEEEEETDDAVAEGGAALPRPESITGFSHRELTS